MCFSRIRKQVIIVWDKRASTCSMIEKISPKGVSFSDFVCIFALSVEDLFDFYRNISQQNSLYLTDDDIEKLFKMIQCELKRNYKSLRKRVLNFKKYK